MWGFDNVFTRSSGRGLRFCSFFLKIFLNFKVFLVQNSFTCIKNVTFYSNNPHLWQKKWLINFLLFVYAMMIHTHNWLAYKDKWIDDDAALMFESSFENRIFFLGPISCKARKKWFNPIRMSLISKSMSHLMSSHHRNMLCGDWFDLWKTFSVLVLSPKVRVFVSFIHKILIITVSKWWVTCIV